MSRVIAIVGSRDYEHVDDVRLYVRSLPEGVIIVSGRGGVVDIAAEEEARARGWTPIIHPAQWHLFGNRAGPLRNVDIVRDCTEVRAYWDWESDGTRDTLRKARAAKKPAWLWDHALRRWESWGTRQTMLF